MRACHLFDISALRGNPLVQPRRDRRARQLAHGTAAGRLPERRRRASLYLASAFLPKAGGFFYFSAAMTLGVALAYLFYEALRARWH